MSGSCCNGTNQTATPGPDYSSQAVNLVQTVDPNTLATIFRQLVAGSGISLSVQSDTITGAAINQQYVEISLSDTVVGPSSGSNSVANLVNTGTGSVSLIGSTVEPAGDLGVRTLQAGAGITISVINDTVVIGSTLSGSTVWLVGQGYPTGVGTSGDFYLDSNTGNFYLNVNGSWNLQGNFKGPTGAMGAVGPQGPQGLTGNIGPKGPQGSPGPLGPQGSPGLTGSQGVPGSAGATGPRGSQWFSGSTVPAFTTGVLPNDLYINKVNGNVYQYTNGAWSLLLNVQGPTGSTGPAGPQGAIGPQGATGAAGAAGPQGSQGLVGAQGPQGVPGAAGAPGPKGATGNTGPAGQNGIQGPAGIQGPTGSTGTRGSQWFTGTTLPGTIQGAINNDFYIDTVTQDIYALRGNTWVLQCNIKGLTGPAGPVGATGAQGSPGSTGAAGPIGAMGPPGVQGTTGAMGPAGPQGLPGTQGPQGLTGPSGAQGPAGVMGPRGAQGFPGQAGANGASGPQGPQGIQGPAGPAGAQGAAGPIGPQGSQGPRGASQLAQLTDVSVISATNNSILVYNLGSDQWVSTPIGEVSAILQEANSTSNVIGSTVPITFTSIPVPLPSQTSLILLDQSYTFPALGYGSSAYANLSATNTQDFALSYIRGGVKTPVTSIVFDTGTNIGTFHNISDVSLYGGDILVIDAPATSDETLTNIAFTIVLVPVAVTNNTVAHLAFPSLAYPQANQSSIIAIDQGYMIPANFTGSTAVAIQQASAASVFALSYVRAGVKTLLTAIEFGINSNVGVFSNSTTEITLQANDLLVLDAPAVADATLTDIVIDVLTTYATPPSSVQGTTINVPFRLPSLPVPQPNQSVMFVLDRNYTVPFNMTGSVFESITLATSTNTFTLSYIRNNGAPVAIGTVLIQPNTSTGIFNNNATTELLAGDVLVLSSPAVPDATLADVAMTLVLETTVQMQTIENNSSVSDITVLVFMPNIHTPTPNSNSIAVLSGGYQLPGTMSGSKAVCLTAATNATTLTLSYVRANITTAVCKIQFAPGSNVGTFNSGISTYLEDGDILVVNGPTTQDPTLANVAFTIALTETSSADY